MKLTETMDDVELIDTLNHHLDRAGALSDALANYHPDHEGVTVFGDTYSVVGFILFDHMADSKKALDRWWEGREAARQVDDVVRRLR